MGYETEKIEEIKSKSNIVEVIGDYVMLKKKGANFLGSCPFHNEKTPSFTVSPAKRSFKCFGCGKGGDAIQFLILHLNKSFSESIEILAAKYNVDLPAYTGAKKEYIAPPPRLEKLNPKYLKWFLDVRHISNESLNHAKVTESVEWMPQAEKEIPVLCFNYYRNGDLVNIKYRGKDKAMKLHKDAKLIFYNMPALEGQTEAVIVEGEIDCLSYIETRIYNCVSVPNGAAKGVQKLEYLDNCWEAFSALEKIILSVDNDEAGRQLQEELARRLGKERCWLAVYPPDKVVLDTKSQLMRPCKDANEVLIKLGPDAVKKMYKDAIPYPLIGEASMFQMEPELDTMYRDGYPPGKAAGIPGFDELLTFMEGQLTVVTGIPGHGKDEFINYVCTGLAKRHGWIIGVFGFEEPPVITATKIIEKHAGKAFDHRKDLNNRLNDSQYQEGKLFAREFFKFINTDEIETTVDKVMEKATELVVRHGINGLIINPWASLEHALAAGESETLYISRSLGKILSFCKKYRVHCFLMAHPTKVPNDKKTLLPMVPTMYMVSGSANFYNKPHNGISVYRHFDTGQADVYVQKVKWSWLGKTGVCSFKYNTMTRQYSPLILNKEKEAEYSNELPPLKTNFRVITASEIPFNQQPDEDTDTETPVDFSDGHDPSQLY